MQRSLESGIRNRDGVALPLALLGLVSVSLLVTTALVTSSTELAISSAHQDATAALYTAEGGLQAYVAANGPAVQDDAGQGEFGYTPPGGGSDVVLSVVHLGNQVMADQSVVRLYSVVARPDAGGGRMISAIVTQIVPAPLPMNLNITSAMTVAGDLEVDGNAFAVNGQSTACGATGVEALRLASDSELVLGNDNQYDDRVTQFSGTTDAGVNTSGEAVIERGGTRASLVSGLLGGRTIDELAAAVPTTRWRYRNQNPAYTTAWLAGALAGQGGVAVVDAQNGSISVGPGTYTGILIVINGSVELSGNVTFNGIIIAEKNFSLSGNVTVNGAVASLAMDGQNVVNNGADDSGMNGSVSVSYDKCAVDDAMEAYSGLTNNQTPLVRRTASWLEVVR